MAFAGLWEEWKSPQGPVESCTICTTHANDMMGQLHDRMPVILPRNAVDLWLDPRITDPKKVKPLLLQYPGAEMVSWAVGRAVGNVKNQGEDLMKPIDEPRTFKFD